MAEDNDKENTDLIYKLGNKTLELGHSMELPIHGYSMFPLLRKGDTGIVKKVEISQVKVGDIIVFESELKWIAHRLIKCEFTSGTYLLTTKGDSQWVNDSSFSEKDYVGKVIAFKRNGKTVKLNRFVNSRFALSIVKSPSFFTRVFNYLLRYRNLSDKISAELAQLDYYKWVENTNADIQKSFTGETLSENEAYFIDKYAKDSIIDVGCGPGERTFPDYIKRKLKYTGIERSEHLIKSKGFEEHILQGDLCSQDFDLVLSNIEGKADIAVLFGFVINGFIDDEKKKQAWQNLQKIASSKAKLLLVDTFTHFEWFPIDLKGRIVRLDARIPPQYYYSEKELDRLFSENNLEIIERKNESTWPGTIRTQYVLKLIL